MSDIDIIAVQIAAEEKVREEYEASMKKLQDEHKTAMARMHRFSDMMESFKGALVQSGTYTADADELVDADAVLNTLIELVTEYFKMRKLLEAINDNILLKSQWDRLVMSIRLAGGDQV